MMCGSKCYLVTIELAGQIKKKRVRARTPVNARKFIRKSYGDAVIIHSAIVEK